MDTATTDKSALAFGDDFLHGRGQSERQGFGEELRQTMDEANRSVICNLFGSFLFGNKDNIGRI